MFQLTPKRFFLNLQIFHFPDKSGCLSSLFTLTALFSNEISLMARKNYEKQVELSFRVARSAKNLRIIGTILGPKWPKIMLYFLIILLEDNRGMITESHSSRGKRGNRGMRTRAAVRWKYHKTTKQINERKDCRQTDWARRRWAPAHSSRCFRRSDRPREGRIANGEMRIVSSSRAMDCSLWRIPTWKSAEKL